MEVTKAAQVAKYALHVSLKGEKKVRIAAAGSHQSAWKRQKS